MTAAAETALVLKSHSIDSMRATPVSSPVLAPPLQLIAEELAVRPRTEALIAFLEREMSAGNNLGHHVCDIWRGARAFDRTALRLLASLLEVRLSGVELLRRALGGTQLFRAYRRAARGAPEYASDAHREILEAGHGFAVRVGAEPKKVHTPEARAAIRRRAGGLLESLLAGRIRESELAWLTGFAELELRATSMRLAELASGVGAYDGERISRLLPTLSRHEERLRDTRALLMKLPAPEELVRRTPVLAGRLEDRSFDELVREIGLRPEGREVARALVLTAWRGPLAPELAFFGGLVRLLAERYQTPDKHPLDPGRALLLVLLSHRPRGLCLELDARELRLTGSLWETIGARPRPGPFLLPWNPAKYEPLLPEDGAPELAPPDVRRAVDMRVLVLKNVGNEQVLCGLLQVPRVASLPGLVEMVVTRTRSLKVLLEIANRRDLHSGAANRNVPRALLWHPSNIPLSALRKFVHVRHVDRVELMAMSNRNSRARPEVRQEVAAYLATLSK